jgi:hypothetical protein
MDSEIIIYQTKDGDTRIDVRLENENVWLNQTDLCLLYQKTKSTISEHIKEIFNENELDEKSVVRKYRTTASDGKSYNTAYYNLDMIIAIGYRVKSHVGTQFRIWATSRLKEYITKGFTIDDDKLKKNVDYFNELLERIRDIRTSEKVFYQKIKDIYATSIDYDSSNEMTQKFFSIVQNKLLWAISGHTAAEVVHERANAKAPYMGLTSWANQKQGGAIRKADVSISKNYLNENEIKSLNLLVEQYLAFAESQAHNRKPMYMNDWIKKLNDILIINDKEILQHAGRISKKSAENKAEKQFEIFKEQQKQLDYAESLKELEQNLKLLKTKQGRNKE